MPSRTRQSELKQLEDLKRRINKKPMGKTDTKRTVNRRRDPFMAKTDNPMGKDRVRVQKLKKISQIMEKKSPYLKQEGPKRSLPPKSRGTGGVNRGGFRKPDTSRIRPGILSNRKKVNKAG